VERVVKMMIAVYTAASSLHRIMENPASVLTYYTAPPCSRRSARISAAAAAVAAADGLFLHRQRARSSDVRSFTAPLYKHSTLPGAASLQPTRKPISPAHPSTLHRRCCRLHAPETSWIC